MNVNKMIDFMELIGRLKHEKRTGWLLRKIPDPESIAGHMYRMAMLSFLVDPKSNLDKSKIIKMSLVHDLAESIIGDITPCCGVTVENKFKMENEAMERICKNLGDRGAEILELFKEYEKRESPEARYVKDLDRVDLLMQAFEYEKRENRPGEFQEFFDNSQDLIVDPFLTETVKEINNRRAALFKDEKNDTEPRLSQ